MKRILILFLFSGAICTNSHAQLSVGKILSKTGKNSNLGFGLFAFWDIPVGEMGNGSIMIECLDAMYFPPKNKAAFAVGGFVSIKAGYKYIFSQESKTGFYVEPSAGWVRVVDGDESTTSYGDGLALAAEAGYSLEVGQRGNNFNFGLKLERDMASGVHKVTTLAFRVSYAFHMFKRREG